APAPAVPWRSALPASAQRSPPRQVAGAGTLATEPGAVGPGPWLAGQGRAARGSLAPRAVRVGGLVAALGWVSPPGPRALAAWELATAACYSTDRGICG